MIESIGTLRIGMEVMLSVHARCVFWLISLHEPCLHNTVFLNKIPRTPILSRCLIVWHNYITWWIRPLVCRSIGNTRLVGREWTRDVYLLYLGCRDIWAFHIHPVVIYNKFPLGPLLFCWTVFHVSLPFFLLITYIFQLPRTLVLLPQTGKFKFWSQKRIQN